MITNKSKNFFRVSTDDFKKIPGSPIAYWATENVRNLYTSNAISFLKYLDPWCGEFRRLAVPSFRTTAGKSVSQSNLRMNILSSRFPVQREPRQSKKSASPRRISRDSGTFDCFATRPTLRPIREE